VGVDDAPGLGDLATTPPPRAVAGLGLLDCGSGRCTPLEDAVFYLCGPRPFLRALVGGLARSGAPLNRIRYEFFGPADELLAA
jgi:hypothetical protein